MNRYSLEKATDEEIAAKIEACKLVHPQEACRVGMYLGALEEIERLRSDVKMARAERDWFRSKFCKDHLPEVDESWAQYGCPVCEAGRQNNAAKYAELKAADRHEWQGVALKLSEVRDQLRRLLFHVIHQRTGPMGEKVEDILLQENEPLLLKIIEHVKDL